MQYYQASLIGQKRARDAQHKLFGYSGFAFLTKTVKQKGDEFEPVGEEEFIAIDTINDEAIVVICDADGYAKAQTKPISMKEAKNIFERMLNDGFKEYNGKIKSIK